MGRLTRFFVIAGVSSLAMASGAAAQPVDCEVLPAGLADCVRDQDCMYWPQLYGCDCGNGGSEVAINRKQLGDLQAWQDACPAAACLFFYNCRGYEGARCEQGTCVLGSCGDAIVAAGESCDTGGPSATCDGDCTVPACGDWNVNAMVGETCDDGGTAEGDGCSSACACDDASDADGDGVGDDCDACVNSPDGATSSVLGLRSIGSDPILGDDALTQRMDFTLGAGVSFADLDPVADGLRLRLQRGSGAPALDLQLPAGMFDGVRGWRANASGTVWSFLDKSAGPVATGIRKARVLDRSSKSPGAVSLKLSGRDADYAVAAFDAPLRVTIAIGDGAGRCGERIYDRSDCRVNAPGDTIKCRR